MATRPRTKSTMSLEEFLASPRIDEKPYLEYYDGRIEAKVSAQRKHCVIQKRIIQTLDRFAEPSRLGAAFGELRCTFSGRSIVPDVVFRLDAHVPCNDLGEVTNESLIPPDIRVEIRSPDQSVTKTKEKLEHSIANGCPLGWYIDPERKTIDVYRPGLAPERLAADGVLDGSPVLPGVRLPVAEVFGWLIYRVHRTNEPGAELP